MAVTTWIPESLKLRMRNRRCVAFVGAGFSAPCMPDWGGLLRQLYSAAVKHEAFESRSADWKDWESAIGEKQFQLAASLMYHYLGAEEDRRWLSQQIKRLFGTHLIKGHPNEQTMRKRMDLMTKIPWLGIVTTNFDVLIRAGFDNAGQRYSAFVQGFQASDEPWNGLLLGGIHDLQCEPEIPWILHLHGTVEAEGITLSAEQFEDLYVHDRRVESFVGALLLSCNVVFLGCSMTDEIVKIRRVLRKRFRNIPKDYALLVSSVENIRRAKYLSESAGLEVVLYGTDGNDFAAFDDCLQEFAECAPANPLARGGRMLTDLAISDVDQRIDVLDDQNIALLKLVDKHGRLKYSTLMTPEETETKKSPEIWENLLAMGSGERFYRMAFLVQLRLVRDQLENGYTSFELDPEESCRIHELINSPC